MLQEKMKKMANCANLYVLGEVLGEVPEWKKSKLLYFSSEGGRPDGTSSVGQSFEAVPNI